MITTAVADLGTPTPESTQEHLNRLSARITTQNALIADLQAAAAHAQQQLTAAHDRYELAVRQHQTDIATIGARLCDEAEDRSWCEEYDTIVDKLNTQLTVALPLRERDFEVAADVRVTIQVTARGNHDAEEQAGEIVREIERVIDGHAQCTAHPNDSRDWEIRSA